MHLSESSDSRQGANRGAVLMRWQGKTLLPRTLRADGRGLRICLGTRGAAQEAGRKPVVNTADRPVPSIIVFGALPGVVL